MRKLLLTLALVLMVAACSSGSDPVAPTTSTTAFDDLPPALRSVLDRARPPGQVAFDGTYQVFKKLGGVSTTVRVRARTAKTTITVDRRRVTTESALADRGVFSDFFADGPARIVATDARRPTAGDPVLTDRTVAGIALRCAGVPINGDVATTACFSAAGIVGWFDSPAVHYELTAYRPT